MVSCGILFFMKPTSLSLRRRIIHARQVDKQSMGQIALRFQVPKGTVQNIIEHYRETGTLDPKAQNAGRKSAFSQKDLDALELFDRENPDATLEEMKKASKVNVSLVTFHNNLKKLGFTRKKKRYVPPNKTSRM